MVTSTKAGCIGDKSIMIANTVAAQICFSVAMKNRAGGSQSRICDARPFMAGQIQGRTVPNRTVLTEGDSDSARGLR